MNLNQFREHLDDVGFKLDQLFAKARSLELCDVPDVGLTDCVNRLNHFIITAKIDIDAEHQCCPAIAAQVSKLECDREDAVNAE